MSKYELDIKVTTRWSSVLQKDEAFIGVGVYRNTSRGTRNELESCRYTVRSPGWFGQKVLKHTFESRIKNQITHAVQWGKDRIAKFEYLDSMEDVVKDAIDGILHRTP